MPTLIRHVRLRRAAVAVAAVASVLLTGCTASQLASLTSAASHSHTSVAATGKPGSVSAALASLPVKGRAPQTGYTREQFGTAWTDDNDDPFGGNHCDSRNDVLHRDLTDITYKAGSHCLIATGTLAEPYTGKTIHFVRGIDTSTAVQIDHVVALSDAWQTGAQKLTARQRVDLANDPLNLLAADGPTNMSKGDGDAATWLPPNKAFRCRYVSLQIAVKHKYHLWVTAAERDAMARVLARCPSRPLPAEPGGQ